MTVLPHPANGHKPSNWWLESVPYTGTCIMAQPTTGVYKKILLGRISGNTLYLYNRSTKSEVPIDLNQLTTLYRALVPAGGVP